MKFDIKKIGIVFCLLCLMVTMMVPAAFAAGLTDCDLRTDDEFTYVRYGYGVTNLYVDDGEPLTFQYFLDNPKYSLTITHDYHNFVKLIARGGQITLSSSGTTISLNHDIVKGYIDAGKVTAADDIAFYVDSNDASREYVFSIVQIGSSDGVKNVLTDVGGFTSSLFGVATKTAAWIIANPLALIVCIIFLFGCGIMLFRKLIKGA